MLNLDDRPSVEPPLPEKCPATEILQPALPGKESSEKHYRGSLRGRHTFKIKTDHQLQMPRICSLSGWSDDGNENQTNTDHDATKSAHRPVPTDPSGLPPEISDNREEELSEITPDEIECINREIHESQDGYDEMDTDSSDNPTDDWSIVSSLQMAIWRVFSVD